MHNCVLGQGSNGQELALILYYFSACITETSGLTVPILPIWSFPQNLLAKQIDRDLPGKEEVLLILRLPPKMIVCVSSSLFDCKVILGANHSAGAVIKQINLNCKWWLLLSDMRWRASHVRRVFFSIDNPIQMRVIWIDTTNSRRHGQTAPCLLLKGSRLPRIIAVLLWLMMVS